MAKLELKSEQQITGNMISTLLARTGLNDINPGSVFLALLTAAAREDYQQYYQMLQIVRNYNLDTTTGSDLDNRAFEYGLVRTSPKRATGKITILREEGFEKIASTHYTGFRSRIAGDTEIFLNDASNFPSSGTNTLILGRGTPNEEEVDYVGSPTNPEDNTNYFKITLSSPLTNDHGLEEEVVLKQGTDVTVAAGTNVRVPATANSEEILFQISRDVVLLAGEDRVTDVDIRAAQPGTDANIGVNSISGTEAFPAAPFNGARAQNESAFSNGQDRETDTELRNRIRSHIQGLTQSTKAGIANEINGLVDPNTAKRVVSSNIILPDNVGLPVKIYIDDGTGFEPAFENQGQETIVQEAAGSEKRLQLDLFPLVKAQVETVNSEPYDFSTNGLTLSLNVGPDTETLTFFTNDFSIPEAATAEEVVAAINNKSSLIEARTSQTGTKIVVNSKEDQNEGIQILGGTANTSDNLNFPVELVQTFYLYKNDQLLSKDGETAFIESGNSAPFDFSGPDRDLLVTIDGKSANIQTVTIKETDFASAAAAAAASAAEVAEIINSQLAGGEATAIDGQVRITSNTKLSSDSKVKINTSAANTVLGFSTLEVVGKDQDYKLNPELGIIELTEPLVENDKLTAGTRNTRAFLTASIAEDYTFAGSETLEIQVDGGATQTIVFPTLTNQSAAQVADVINDQAEGFFATTRTFGNDVFLELRTNTFDLSGSIEILSSSTANSIFGFTLDTEIVNLPAHVAYQVSANSGPFEFIEDYTLVVVLDNDPSGKTFVVTMDYDGTVTSGTSTTLFAASGFNSIFTENDALNDFYIVFKSGDNSTSGTVSRVENPSGSTFRYVYDTPPANFGDFAIGDQVSFDSMQEAANNGNFLIEAVSTQNNILSSVLDKDLDTPPASPSVGDRYIVAETANDSLEASVLDKDLDSPPGGPGVGDKYIVASTANDTKLNSVLDVLPSSSLATTTHGNRYLIDRTSINTLAPVNSIENDDTGLNNALGERYLIGAFPVNGFAGRAHQIAIGTGSGFTFFVPSTDDEVFVNNIGETYYFDGSTWEENEWAIHANEIAEYNGVGSPGWDYTTPNDDDVVEDTSTNLVYQFDLGSGIWVLNPWGGSAGKVAEWDGAAWIFATPINDEVREVTDESARYQYDLSSNSWSENAWGGQAQDIAEWGGSSWSFTTAATNDVTTVDDESLDYIFDGSSWSLFEYWVEVSNSFGELETGSTGTGLIGQRRQISDYVATSGAITLASAVRDTPAPNDEFVILPSTKENVVDFLNNTKVTSLSGRANIELAEQNDKIQISSKLNGSDGYVQITGGRANNLLGFSTTLLRGLRAYSHYVGLTKLVHRTVYGDEADLVAFPGVGAAGVKYQILAPTVQEVAFIVELTLTEGTSLSNVENNVKSAVTSYVKTLGVGEPVILSRVVEAVLEVDGLIDVKITAPSNNVDIAENELARTKASLITIEQT